jgi:hypothetical protein
MMTGRQSGLVEKKVVSLSREGATKLVNVPNFVFEHDTYQSSNGAVQLAQ